MDFSEWIARKFLEWRGERIGRGSSVADFAALFNAPQSLMSQWMKKGGKVPRSAKYVNALVKIYGSEVYTILGLQPPAPPTLNGRLLTDGRAPVPYATLPPKLQLAFLRWQKQLSAQSIDPSSPAADDLFLSILSDLGWKSDKTE